MYVNRIPVVTLTLAAALFLVFFGPTASAQITVSGLDDREFYTDEVEFTIEEEAGFTYEATLNGAAVAPGNPVSVRRAEYYELEVTRTDDVLLTTESETYRFIVRAGDRGSSESGLPPWVPLANIPSAPPKPTARRWTRSCRRPIRAACRYPWSFGCASRRGATRCQR